MLGTARFLIDRQRSLIQRLGVRVATLLLVQRREIVQRFRKIGMLGTERFLPDGQCSLEKRLGVRIATLLEVQRREIVQRISDIGMLGTERFLIDRQRSLIQRLGVRIATNERLNSDSASTLMSNSRGADGSASLSTVIAVSAV
jgi:hypothetical protein